MVSEGEEKKGPMVYMGRMYATALRKRRRVIYAHCVEERSHFVRVPERLTGASRDVLRIVDCEGFVTARAFLS